MCPLLLSETDRSSVCATCWISIQLKSERTAGTAWPQPNNQSGGHLKVRADRGHPAVSGLSWSSSGKSASVRCRGHSPRPGRCTTGSRRGWAEWRRWREPPGSPWTRERWRTASQLRGSSVRTRCRCRWGCRHARTQRGSPPDVRRGAQVSVERDRKPGLSLTCVHRHSSVLNMDLD